MNSNTLPAKGLQVMYRDVIDTVEGGILYWPSMIVHVYPGVNDKPTTCDLAVFTSAGVKTILAVKRGSGYGQWGTRGEFGVL